MFLPCPSCKAELSSALVGAEGRCPYCGTLAVADAPAPAKPAPPVPPLRPAADPNDPEDTAPSPRARVTAPVGAVVAGSARGEPGPDGRRRDANPNDPDDTVPSPRAGRGETPVGGAASGPASEAAPPPRRPEPGALPRGWGGITVGVHGILSGKPARVTGRVRYTVDRPRTIAWWDAWAIRFSDGAEGWLLDREGTLATARPWTIQVELDPAQLTEGRLVRLDGGPPATVVDVGTAVVRGTEGVTDFEKGLRLHYATLAGDQWRYQLLWSADRPLECWRGERVEPAMLAAGFGLRAPSGFKESAASSVEWIGQLPLSMQVALLLLAIPLIAGAVMVLLFGRFAALFE